MLQADLTQREVQAPHNRWCQSGHVAPEQWEREPGGPLTATRFFHVSSANDAAVNGVYCEPCLVVAHWQAAQQRNGR